MENVLFDRSPTASLEPFQDGKLIFSTSGDGAIYLDNGNERLRMGGNDVDSELSTVSENPLQNKVITATFSKKSDIINTIDDVKVITSDNIPCGTKPVKTLANEKVSGFTQDTYQAVTGLAYDATNKKLGLKVGADTVIPFSGGVSKCTAHGQSQGTNPTKTLNLPSGGSCMVVVSYGTDAEHQTLNEPTVTFSGVGSNTQLVSDSLKQGYYATGLKTFLCNSVSEGATVTVVHSGGERGIIVQVFG